MESTNINRSPVENPDQMIDSLGNNAPESQRKSNSMNENDGNIAAAAGKAEKWKLNLTMALFVILTSVRYISIKQIDTTEVEREDGKVTHYKHPLL